MSTSTHTIYEQGQGFPEPGERVYSSEENAVYLVDSIDSGILTVQWRPNRVLATLVYDCDPTELEDEEFAALRDARVERLAGH